MSLINKLNLNFFKKDVKNKFFDLKKRCIFNLWALIVFRIGSFIPIPGINLHYLEKILQKTHGSIIDVFNMFSGGALSRASIFALGIMPYISASIIIHLLSTFNPVLLEIKKEGEIGQQKINRYIRYTTLFLAILQSIVLTISIPNIPFMQELILHKNISFYFTSIISLICGTMFLMWIGEQITEKGIGNGISIIIFTGIISGLPSNITRTINFFNQKNLSVLSLILTTFFIFLTIFLVVFIERGQRKITIHYAKRQQGRKMYVSQSTHLPLKINMGGVMPAIFAFSIIVFPSAIISWLGENKKWKLFSIISYYLAPGQLIYFILYSISIMFFCFFYTELSFNTRDTANNLKNSGAFLSGIRPGEQTAKYLKVIVNKLTFLGAIYMIVVCLTPEIMRYLMNVPFYFGGTCLMTVVVVIMEFISQVQTIIISKQYESTLKKAHLKNFNK